MKKKIIEIIKEYVDNHSYQKKNNNVILIFIAFAIVLASVSVYWIMENRRATRENLNIEFSGSIEYIDYDLKQCPTITIGNKSYYIGVYDTDHQIEIGDSIIKKRGPEMYKLVKYKSKKIIELTRK